ncbi:MAG: hypothetical protein UX22_C0026G0009 [Candidatus Jorgensenbacteria bacterium GW2011_GWA2_45_9]|nr:MAG: hypothetical protein UX22_C0026G0009 [Candidatus Jorgensenbacteria bacterium GW2011_GWA2_45_9]
MLMEKCKKRDGQLMIIVTIIIGFVVLSSTALAGFLLYSQIKQSNDSVASGMALFATDAGLETALYRYYLNENVFGVGANEQSELSDISVILSNSAGADANLWCVDADMAKVSCSAATPVYGFKVRSIGSAARTERIIETFYATKYN